MMKQTNQTLNIQDLATYLLNTYEQVNEVRSQNPWAFLWFWQKSRKIKKQLMMLRNLNGIEDKSTHVSRQCFFC